MRTAALVTSLLVATSLAMVSIAARSHKPEASTEGNTYFTDIVASRDKTLLDKFQASLDPTIMRACVDHYDRGGQMDLDRLATCGDFDAYAAYLRVSKFEAVKKFEYVLLHSSSKLEFDDRLAR